MKNILFILFISVAFASCKDKTVDPNSDKTPAELISLNLWKLERYSSTTGQSITNAELNTQALFLFAMNFDFKSNGEVRGIDKASNNIIDKGVWKFIDNETSVNVKLTGLDYDFRIIVLQTGKLTLQAPTGNFLTGLGEQVNLEFSSVSQ